MFQSLSNMLVWDIAAGSHYSLFLGDSFQNKADVYVCGKKPRYIFDNVVKKTCFVYLQSMPITLLL